MIGDKKEILEFENEIPGANIHLRRKKRAEYMPQPPLTNYFIE